MVVSSVEMKIFSLFVIFLGFSQANECKHWRRSMTPEDPRAQGKMIFSVTTSAMFKCSMKCSANKKCSVFTYDQQTGNCTGCPGFTSEGLSTPDDVFYRAVPYTVTIITGNEGDSRTDARVFLKMYGSLGTTNEIELVDNTPDKLKFDDGKTDVFNVTSVDIGTLQKIKIGHDNTGKFPGWYIETITVSMNGQSAITFVVNRWIEEITQLYITIDAP